MGLASMARTSLAAFPAAVPEPAALVPVLFVLDLSADFLYPKPQLIPY